MAFQPVKKKKEGLMFVKPVFVTVWFVTVGMFV
jgi:hypothetical protein